MADPEVDEAFSHSFPGAAAGRGGPRAARGGERTENPPGTTIYTAGAEPYAALVVRGLLRVYMTSAEGRQVTVRYALAAG